jgi:hypothetical protein
MSRALLIVAIVAALCVGASAYGPARSVKMGAGSTEDLSKAYKDPALDGGEGSAIPVYPNECCYSYTNTAACDTVWAGDFETYFAAECDGTETTKRDVAGGGCTNEWNSMIIKKGATVTIKATKMSFSDAAMEYRGVNGQTVRLIANGIGQKVSKGGVPRPFLVSTQGYVTLRAQYGDVEISAIHFDTGSARRAGWTQTATIPAYKPDGSPLCDPVPQPPKKG